MTENKPNSADNDWDANEHYKDDNVAKNYDDVRFSSAAGRVFNNLEQATVVKAFSSLQPGTTIADIPCGTGRLAEPLLEHGFKVHGMDISEEMLSVARERVARFGDRFTTEVCDAKTLDRSHPQYDGVLCARVLMHFPLEEQIKFLRGVAQITTGPILINQSYSTPYLRFRRKVKRWLRHQPPARYPITNAEISRLLKESGLKEVRRYRLNALISEAIYILAEPL